MDENELDEIREEIKAIKRSLKQDVPPNVPLGTILPYAGLFDPITNPMPEGWMLCDGTDLKRVEYESLFKILGTAWGAKNKSTFKLPDLRGQFLRGVDDSPNLDDSGKRKGPSGKDPDKDSRASSQKGGNVGNAVGSGQDDAMQSHKHDDSGHQHKFPEELWSQPKNQNGSDNYMGFQVATFPNHARYSGTNLGVAKLTDPVNSGTGAGKIRHGKETRPKNVYVYWIIRVK